MLHKITLSGYEARLASGFTCGAALTLGTAGSYGVEQLLVTAAEDWQELSIRASFQPAGVRILISPGQVAEVPWEATQAPLPYPKGRIVFQGFAEGKLVTTCDLPYSVAAHSAAGEQAPQPPTPDEYEQFVQQVQADADRAEAAAGRAAQSAGRAEDAASQAAKAAGDAKDTLGVIEETASKALTDIESGKRTALESITHQKEDALSAVSQAQDDATGTVQTAKQEAVAAITHTGTSQTQAVTRAGEQAVQEVDTAAQAGVGSVEQAQKTAAQAVQTAATAAIQRVEQTGGTQVQAVTAAGAGQVKKIEDAAAEKLEGITQLAGQAEDSATKAEQAAQRAEDAATAASTIIDDTAITSARTWSSLHILETLCPPIQATGNPVVCHPVAGYPLNVTVDFAPIQEGEGDPSPENIRPIKARESVDVTRCGANLLNITPFAPIERNGIKFEYVASGGIRITGTADKLTDSPVWPLALPPGMYKMSTYENLSHQIVVTRGGEKVYLSANRPVEILRGDAVEYYYFLVNKGKPVATTIFPSLSISTVPLETAPYTGQITSLTLPAPCYGGELDAVSGKGQETWKLVTLDGLENWRYESDVFFVGHSILSNLPTQTDGKCSHFIYRFDYAGDNIFCTGDSIYTGIKLTAKYTGTDEWKSYLAAQYAAGTPVQIAYKVATPTPITATGGKPITALAGVNTLLTDGDALTVTGRADIVHALAEMSQSVTQNAQVVDAMLGINPKRLD